MEKWIALLMITSITSSLYSSEKNSKRTNPCLLSPKNQQTIRKLIWDKSTNFPSDACFAATYLSLIATGLTCGYKGLACYCCCACTGATCHAIAKQPKKFYHPFD